MKFVNDRLSQWLRIAQLQGQPQSGDNIIEVAPRLAGVCDLSDPIRTLFLSGAAPAPGTAAAPFGESFASNDIVDITGVFGLDSRNLCFCSPGLWHLNLLKQFSFSGTTNFAKQQRLRLTTVTPDLGTIIGSTDLIADKYISGQNRVYERNLWLPMLAVWTLVTIGDTTVALDELHSSLSLVLRRFF